MVFNKMYNIGKIRTFDNFIGEIVAQNGVYIFLTENISDTEKVSINDTVMFRGEEIHGVKRALFIKKIDPGKKIEDEISRKLTK